MGVALVGAIVWNTLTAPTARDNACALVAFWGDSSGTVKPPSAYSGAVTESDAVALAQKAWPDDTGTAARFVGLYDGLSSDESDAAYDAEARSFLDQECS